MSTAVRDVPRTRPVPPAWRSHTTCAPGGPPPLGVPALRHRDIDFSTPHTCMRRRRRFDDEPPVRRWQKPASPADLDGRGGTDPDWPPAGDRWSTWTGALHGPAPRPQWVVTEHAAVDTDLGILKSGKEADVHLLERAVPGSTRRVLLAAKRYRTAEHRLFHRDAGYLEGRRVRRSRETRAMANRTAFGRELLSGQWAAAEFAALARLWADGVAVPYPVQLEGTELLLEFIGDHDTGEAALAAGAAAPRARPGGAAVAPAGRGAARLARHGLTHGDLSAYNLLVHDGRLVLIDLPQVVDVVGNPQGPQFLARDVQRVAGWFTARGISPQPRTRRTRWCGPTCCCRRDREKPERAVPMQEHIGSAVGCTVQCPAITALEESSRAHLCSVHQGVTEQGHHPIWAPPRRARPMRQPAAAISALPPRETCHVPEVLLSSPARRAPRTANASSPAPPHWRWPTPTPRSGGAAAATLAPAMPAEVLWTVPATGMPTFADLGLRAVRAHGWWLHHPFPIQAATLPETLAGRDLLGRAQTGSGKTLAFGLALLSRLDGERSQARRPRGLVLVPTGSSPSRSSMPWRRTRRRWA